MAKKKDTAKPKEKTEKVSKPKAISPFDIINMMFTDQVAFDNLSKTILAKNFFMINRVFSIAYPMQAQCFNKLNISKHDVIKSWQVFAISQHGYGRVPYFVYTKGGKKTMEDKVEDFDKETKTAYCLHKGISYKDLDDMLYFMNEQTKNDINKYIEISNSNFIDKIKI